MTKTWHRRTAVASMFQSGISRNTKCAERDSFRRAGHNYWCNEITMEAYVCKVIALFIHQKHKLLHLSNQQRVLCIFDNFSV